MKPATFTVTMDITDETIAHLLCSAREGGQYGSGYWAEFYDCPYTCEGASILPLRLPVKVRDLEEGKTHVLNLKKVRQGVALLPTVPGLLKNILADNTDGGDGDNFLQLCLFGEVIYG